MQEKVTGMVLSGTPVGEYDKRLVILTKERGKISAFARGARRPKSSLLAASEPFTFGEFALYRGRDSYTVSSVEVSNYFSDLREELEDIYMGMYFCEVADYFTRENLDAKEVLKLLYQSLRALKVPSLPRGLVKMVYEFKMIALNGEAPRLFACASCGQRKDWLIFTIGRRGFYATPVIRLLPIMGREQLVSQGRPFIRCRGSSRHRLKHYIRSVCRNRYSGNWNIL